MENDVEALNSMLRRCFALLGLDTLEQQKAFLEAELRKLGCVEVEPDHWLAQGDRQ